MLTKKILMSMFIIIFYFHTFSIARKNSSIDEVTVRVITQSLDSVDIDCLKGWFINKLEVFSDEKKYFIIAKNDTFTHVVNIYIDSIILIDYLEYRKQLDIADSVSSVIWQIEEKMRFVNIYNSHSIYPNSITGAVIKRAYNSVEHPVMYVRLEIIDLNGKVSLKVKKTLQSSSPVPVNEQKQINDLLGILKNYVIEKIPYTHM